MAKRGVRRKAKAERIEIVDATSERLCKGDDSEFIDPAKIDSSEQRIGLTRRFTQSHLDRLWKRGQGKITDRQWTAGDWYRATYIRAGIDQRVTSNYGGASGGGEISYGMATCERQARARQHLRKARDAMAKAKCLGTIERFVVHDELPRFGGRAAVTNVSGIGRALDALADWLGC